MLYDLPIHGEGGMFRRYRPLYCLVMTCFVALLVSASPAIASRGEFPNLEPLWKAYPLNTGERPVKTNERPFVPPATGVVEAFIPTSNRDLGGVFRPTLLLVLFAAVIAPVLLKVSPRLMRPKPNDDGSDRLFAYSVIGALVAAETLYGYAIFTLVAWLL